MAEIPLSMDELRALSAYAAECAEEVLEIYEREHPTDTRPREAVDEAWTFARGGNRGKALRDKAFAGLKAAKEANTEAAREAARAAVGAAGSAYLHPLPNATQVKHILGSAACAARALELVNGEASLEHATERATPTVVEVLRRYPAAPQGGGRVGELIRELDQALRSGQPGAAVLSSPASLLSRTADGNCGPGRKAPRSQHPARSAPARPYD